MYFYCDNDALLLMRLLQVMPAFFATIIISWSRHGEPAEPEVKHDPLTIIQMTQFDGKYAQAVQMVDPLTTTEREAVRRMVEDGVTLSRRKAAGYGLTRATWNKIRTTMVTHGMAEYRDDGAMVLNTDGARYISPTDR